MAANSKPAEQEPATEASELPELVEPGIMCERVDEIMHNSCEDCRIIDVFNAKTLLYKLKQKGIQGRLEDGIIIIPMKQLSPEQLEFLILHVKNILTQPVDELDREITVRVIVNLPGGSHEFHTQFAPPDNHKSKKFGAIISGLGRTARTLLRNALRGVW